MKLGDVLLFSLSIALIIIGIHLSLTQGIGSSYAVFMFAIALLFWFQYRRINSVEKKKTQNPKNKKKVKKR